MVLLAAVVLASVPQPGFAAHALQTLDVEPETGAAATGSPYQLTATLGAPATTSTVVYFELTGGPNDADGYTPETPDMSCTVAITMSSCVTQYTPAFANVDSIRAWVHHSGAAPQSEPDHGEGINELLVPGDVAEPDRTDVVSVVVGTGGGGGGAQVLDCDDEAPAGNGDDIEVVPTTGSEAATHVTYTCKVTVSGTGVANVTIDAENLTAGVNDADAGKVAPPDYGCVTTAAGTCTFDVPLQTGTLQAGTALICAWIDGDNDDEVNDATAGDGGNCNEPVDAAENDNGTDVMQVTWQTRVVTTIDILNEDDANVLPGEPNHTVNVKAIDQFGDGIGNVNIDLYVLGGPNAQTGSTVNKECTTLANGTCGITYASNGNNGVDRFCAWQDTGTADFYAPGGAVGDGGACATEPDAPGEDGGNALTDRGQVTWSGGTSVATQLEVTPETPPGGNVAQGTHYGLTATVKDENLQPMSGVLVSFELIGAGDPDSGDSPASPDRQCTTGDNGTCSLTGPPGAIGSSTTFTSETNGTTTVRAWVHGMPADTAEGPDAGEPPDEPAGGTNVPGNIVEPDTTDVVLVRWGRSVTAITASITPDLGVYGIDPQMTGTLTGDGSPLANKTVSIRRRVVGQSGFIQLGSVQTAADGTFQFAETNPSASSDYQASYAGDGENQPSSSPLLRVGIRPGVIFNSSASSLPRGVNVQLSGAVIPAHPGKKVWLQRLDGPSGTWVWVQEIILDGNGRYQFQFKSNGNFCLLFRIAYPTQDTDHLWNVSRNQRVCWS
ncbi:MAG TPA: hypothetical protein VM841_06150 [Actinomycetota bacterium]|nr:hypothetical protein [Actinomycetota bacterium]